MADYSGLPEDRDGGSRLERLGCGLGCIGFVIGAAGAIAIAVALIWILSGTD
jgi:hypothetical protein